MSGNSVTQRHGHQFSGVQQQAFIEEQQISSGESLLNENLISYQTVIPVPDATFSSDASTSVEDKVSMFDGGKIWKTSELFLNHSLK